MANGFCKHYRAMSEHDTCAAGINYATMKGIPFKERPCFYEEGKPKPPATCDKAEYPTKEEEEARRAEIRKMFDDTIVARKAIVNALGGPWKKGMAGGSGEIDCPLCKGEKTLQFSRAGYNGHIHAHCKTKNCVSWME